MLKFCKNQFPTSVATIYREFEDKITGKNASIAQTIIATIFNNQLYKFHPINKSNYGTY